MLADQEISSIKIESSLVAHSSHYEVIFGRLMGMPSFAIASLIIRTRKVHDGLTGCQFTN